VPDSAIRTSIITQSAEMDIALTINPEISTGGQLYEVTRGNERIGRIWERPATTDPARKWRWCILQTPGRGLSVALMPAGAAATLEDAKTQLEAAFLQLVQPSEHSG
jgi:hypothetical protein